MSSVARLSQPELLEQTLVGRAQAASGLDKVRPPVHRPPQGLRPAPPGDPGVVAAAEDRRHVPTPKRRRPRVVRVLGQAGREALVPGRVLAAEHAGMRLGDGLDDDESAQLTSGEDEVADRDLAVDEMIGDALVNALVTAAEQAEGQETLRQLVRPTLIEPGTGRGEQSGNGRGARTAPLLRRQARERAPFLGRRRRVCRRRIGADPRSHAQVMHT